MPDITNLTGVSKPLTKFVEVVARGIGNLYLPTGTVRQAKAEATAQLIRAGADIAERDLLARAAARLGHVESMRQINIENVVKIAHEQLPPEVNSESVNQDWIHNFFSSVQDVSDSDLQVIWAKILAGEVAKPGSYSRRTIEFMKTIDSNEARMLEALLSVTFRYQNGWPFVFTINATREAVGRKIGEAIDWERHFVDIGVLSASESMPRASTFTGQQFSFGKAALIADGPPPTPPSAGGRPQMIEMWTTVRNFTSLGQQLATVATVDVEPGVVATINDELKQLKVLLRSKNPEEGK